MHISPTPPTRNRGMARQPSNKKSESCDISTFQNLASGALDVRAVSFRNEYKMKVLHSAFLLPHILMLRLQSKHQFLPAQFRVVPNEPLHAQVLCTHDHLCEHLMLLPAQMTFRFSTTGTGINIVAVFIHFQCFFSQGRVCWTNLFFFAQFVSGKSSLFVECSSRYVYKKHRFLSFRLPQVWQCCVLPLLSLSDI